MTPEGRIAIDLYPGAVTIASSRPISIPRQFSGCSPDKIVQTVSLLFAACGAAQTSASAEAFEDALSIEPPASSKRVRAALILAETAREHAVRILMDWPHFLEPPEAPDAAMLRDVLHASRKLACALDETGAAMRIGGGAAPAEEAEAAIADLKVVLEQAIFRMDLDEWGAQSDLSAWAQTAASTPQRLVRQLVEADLLQAGAAEVSPLPPIENGAIAGRLFAEDSEEFIAKPQWEGLPRETSALSRSLGHPLVEGMRTKAGYGSGARLAACLVELSQIPARINALSDAPDLCDGKRSRSAGRGVAQVEAARGRLVHAVEMEGGRVARYRILAPTEWNFHPAGAVAQGLRRIAAGGGEREACAWLARLFVIFADPCVGAEVRVH